MTMEKRRLIAPEVDTVYYMLYILDIVEVDTLGSRSKPRSCRAPQKRVEAMADYPQSQSDARQFSGSNGR